jgi:hypothetical protein
MDKEPTAFQTSDDSGQPNLWVFSNQGVHMIPHQLVRSTRPELNQPNFWLLIDGEPNIALTKISCECFVVQAASPATAMTQKHISQLRMKAIFMDLWSWPEICCGM